MVSTNPPSSVQPPVTDHEHQQERANKISKPLDVVFLQDTTGSQGTYIVAARKAIRNICDKISSSANISKDVLRFGLIAFRDHPPMDNTYVTKNFGFTSDMSTMERNLKSLIASGGGDGPEAQTAALAEALNAEWAEGAMKVVILITDSPPHGLKEKGDHFDKSPDQNDPLEIARQMAEHDITLVRLNILCPVAAKFKGTSQFVIACEPSLSYFINAVDFYAALTQITSGRVLPLLLADKLGDYIIGTIVETVETDRLIEEFEKVILDDVYNKSQPMEAVAQNLQQFISDRGTEITTMNVDDIYNPSDTARRNTHIWSTARNIEFGREFVTPIVGPRIQQQYMQAMGITYIPPSVLMSTPRVPPFGGYRSGGRGGRGGGRGGRGGGRGGGGRGGFNLGGTSHAVDRDRPPPYTHPTRMRNMKRAPGVDDDSVHISGDEVVEEGMSGLLQLPTIEPQQMQQQQQQISQAPHAFSIEDTTSSSSELPSGDERQKQMQLQQETLRRRMREQQKDSLHQAPPQQQQISYGKSPISQQQAARIVQRSISRSSKVTTEGYILKSTGQSVPRMLHSEGSN